MNEFNEQIAKVDNITPEQRTRLINNREYTPSYMWNTVGWLADKLNLTPISMQSRTIPMTNPEDLHSDTLNMDIKAGDATGMSAIAILETKEGITIEAESIGKVYSKDDFDTNTWTIYGEPDTTITINKPDTVRLTCADIVNRIPDVIKANPGFIPTSKLPEPTYKIKY